jgi:catechol 2,3-dioxygenase-like lactoylglutathione lyase family enzyme
MRWVLVCLFGCVVGWAQGVKRPAITGVAFARFYTTDVAGAERFYGKTLGFEEREADGRLVYTVNRSQWIELERSAPPKENERMAAVGFTTRDAAGLERYLAAHGVKAEIPLKNGKFGVRDPEGNLVMFVQAGSEKVVAGAPAAARAVSGRVIHVGFIVRDRAKEDAFWKGLLGFRPYWAGGRDPARTDYVSQQVPDGSDWLEYMLNQPATPSLKQAGVMDHVSLGVAEMKAAVEGLEKNGCDPAVCGASKVGIDGKVQLNLYDPDLTRVEMMEFAPMKEPCCSPFMGKHPGAVEEE